MQPEPTTERPSPDLENTPTSTFQKKAFDYGKDRVNNPEWYTSHPSGVSCIEVTEHMGFCLGNVIKYVWRADLKGGVQDLKKARWYIDREIKRREAEVDGKASVSQS